MRPTIPLTAALFLAILSPLAARAQQGGAGGAPPAGSSTSKEEVIRMAPGAMSRATLGLSIQAKPGISPEGKPRWADYPVVSGVVAGSPAERVGVAVGDVILAVNGVDGRELGIMNPQEAGKPFVLRVRRAGEVRELTVLSYPRPTDAQ